MKTRHRLPTIFNLSMVDVLCCALGCVILLWLVNFREAKRRAATAGETSALLTATRAQLQATQREVEDYRQRLTAVERRLRDVQDEHDRTQAQLATLAKDKTQLETDLIAARLRAVELGKEIAALKADLSAAEERLLKKTQDFQTLVKDREVLRLQLETQQKLLKDKEAQAAAVAKSMDDLTLRLRESESLTKKLQTLADLLPKLQEEAADYRAKLKTAESKLASLQKDLDEQVRQTDQAVQARLAAENRFAGITLTGQRVVFVIDMSGSMDYVDAKTYAPDKWTGVCDTVVRILRSLPGLQKFQVILFSDRVLYPLGHEDRWLDYDGQTSPASVHKALTAIKPKGNTNIYAALEAAFRFRNDGLDTIYFLSDGLPNVGPGLPTDAVARGLKEVERSELLSKHVRQTLRTVWNRPSSNGQRVRIHTVGFFYESPELGAFLWALAREHDGSFVGMSKP